MLNVLTLVVNMGIKADTQSPVQIFTMIIVGYIKSIDVVFLALKYTELSRIGARYVLMIVEIRHDMCISAMTINC